MLSEITYLIIIIGVEGLRYNIYILQFYSEMRTTSVVSKHFAYLLKIKIYHCFFLNDLLKHLSLENAHQNVVQCFNGSVSFIGYKFWNISITNIWTTLMQCNLRLHHPFLLQCVKRWNSSTQDVYNELCHVVCYLLQDMCCLLTKQQLWFFCLF